MMQENIANAKAENKVDNVKQENIPEGQTHISQEEAQNLENVEGIESRED